MPDLLPISRYTKFVPFTRTVLVAAALKVVVMALSLFTGVNTVAPRRKAPRNLRSSGVGDSSNFDLVAETTDPQNLLLFADRIGDGDNLGFAGAQHRGETHYSVLNIIAILADHRVNGRHHTPAFLLAHPIGDGRSIEAQFGDHRRALAHAVIQRSGLHLGGKGHEG